MFFSGSFGEAAAEAQLLTLGLSWACLLPVGANTVLVCSLAVLNAVLSMKLRVRASLGVHSAVVGSSPVLVES